MTDPHSLRLAGILPRPPTDRFKRRELDAADFAGMMLSADARSGLRAIAALRNEIRVHEERLIRIARFEGFSWELIARCLHISRQAVHQRWKRRLEPAAGAADYHW